MIVAFGSPAIAESAPAPAPLPSATATVTPGNSTATPSAGPSDPAHVTPAPTDTAPPQPGPATPAVPSEPAGSPARAEVAAEANAALSAGAQAIQDRWQGLGAATGTLGAAKAPATCGLKDGGCLQDFANGTIAWTATTGTQPVKGNILARWSALNGVDGKMGYPTNPETCGLPQGGCYQDYQGGAIIWSPATGAQPTWGPTRARWGTLNFVDGPMRYPTGDVTCGLPKGGCYQDYQGGAIIWSPATGAQPSWGATRMRWATLNFVNGPMGYPTNAETCGLPRGGCYQDYEGGAIIWSPASGAHPTWGAIRTRWAALNFVDGPMGYPTGAETCGLTQGGCYQDYQGGAIIWSPSTGAHPTWGATRREWGARNFDRGSLGFPTGSETCSGDQCVQFYQYGKLSWSPQTGIGYSLYPSSYCESLNRGATRYPGGTSRVSFAVAENYPSTRISFVNCLRQNGSYVTEWSTTGFDGESGFARPGVASGPTSNKYSPTGSFTVTDAFGLGNPGTALNYLTLNPYSRWGGRLNSNYNKYFESSSDIFPDENMWYYATRRSGDYRQGAVINYNRAPDSPITMNAGFAIFLHANPVPTWGCISLSESDVVRYLRTAAPGDRLIMGVGSDVFL
ncbi:LGFP repeat-containing protein [Pseudarthrobacter sp. H2]|uniref:LGFP repeat-containing protein n=1 Tax=Pseudarthrobacter sp. H2 TaxID=3418415 RepID=UPI003CFB295A